MVHEYKNLETAYLDYKKLSELICYEEYIGNLVWRLPGSDARKNGSPSKRQNNNLKYKSEGIIRKENELNNEDGVPSKEFIGEHIVPRKCIIDLIINSYKTKELYSFDDFCKIAEMAKVCLVTKEEDKILNKKKLRQNMPDIKDVWSRYKAAKIKIYEKQDDGTYILLNFS